MRSDRGIDVDGACWVSRPVAGEAAGGGPVAMVVFCCFVASVGLRRRDTARVMFRRM